MKSIALALLHAYKWLISPLLGPTCRYVPSCSEYAMEAVARYGVVKGGLKAAWRLARCHPFAKGGCDPVSSCQSSVSRYQPEPARNGRCSSYSARRASASVVANDSWQPATDN
jgi:uncharacterized protein